MRYKVTVWHGESRTLFYVVDTQEQFSTVSYRDRESAERKANELNLSEARYANRSTLEAAERAWSRGEV
jgi:hypothetical protein